MFSGYSQNGIMSLCFEYNMHGCDILWTNNESILKVIASCRPNWKYDFGNSFFWPLLQGQTHGILQLHMHEMLTGLLSILLPRFVIRVDVKGELSSDA